MSRHAVAPRRRTMFSSWISAAWISAAAAGAFLSVSPASAGAQDLIYACYVPTSCSVYRIEAAGTPSTCTNTSHVQFSWNMQGIQGPVGPQREAGPVGPESHRSCRSLITGGV